jgi:hypothetical protein
MKETVAQYSLRIHELVESLENHIKILEARITIYRKEIEDSHYDIKVLDEAKIEQAARIASLEEENRMLREALRQGGRVRFISVEA